MRGKGAFYKDSRRDGRGNDANRRSRKSFRKRECSTVSNMVEKPNTKTKMCPFSSYRPFGSTEDNYLC